MRGIDGKQAEIIEELSDAISKVVSGELQAIAIVSVEGMSGKVFMATREGCAEYLDASLGYAIKQLHREHSNDRA